MTAWQRDAFPIPPDEPSARVDQPRLPRADDGFRWPSALSCRGADRARWFYPSPSRSLRTHAGMEPCGCENFRVMMPPNALILWARLRDLECPSWSWCDD